MSVKTKITEALEASSLGEAYPGAGHNKQEEPPAQGSSNRVKPEIIDKAAKAGRSQTGTNKLAPKVAAFQAAPPPQGSSKDAPSVDVDSEKIGKKVSEKMKWMGTLTNKGYGKVRHFKDIVASQSAVNQPNSTGGQGAERGAPPVYREDVLGFLSTLGLEISEDNDIGDMTKEEIIDMLMEADFELTEDGIDALAALDEMVLDEEKEEKSEEDEDEDEEEDDEKGKKKGKKGKKDKDEKKENPFLKKEELENDVKNLLSTEENLSEDFKTKAASLFEAAVTARVAEMVSAMEDTLAEEAVAQIAEYESDLVDKVDSFLNYVAEQWLENNEVAVVEGLTTEITRDFIGDLKEAFQKNYIEIPEERLDVIAEMEAKIAELTEAVDEQYNESVELSKELLAIRRAMVISNIAEGLADTEVEKFSTIVADVTYEDDDTFAEKIQVIKENIFPKTKGEKTLTEEGSTEDVEVNPMIDAIVAHMSDRNKAGF